MLLHGDCLERLRELPDCSVDACVTDPPYGLSFMGKAWDYDVPQAEVWREVLRVLKPGGHLLAFAGTRTQHRMAVQIEDAGFEIRDLIAWVYGSGFPKSLDVSKAIDKLDAKEDQERRRLRFTAWVRSTGVTSRQIDEATGTNMGGHYTTAVSQPAIMTREHLEACRHLLGDVPEWVEREADIRSVESQNFKAREVVGHDTKARSTSGASALPTVGGSTVYQSWDITAPATPEAQQWSGWGTALKPALEPITVARKPLCGTVAENVLRHGTGAINVDGCRVPHGDDVDLTAVQRQQAEGTGVAVGKGYVGSILGKEIPMYKPGGRWPANLIHDGSEEPCALLGDAARFFYCAKASKADRGAENVHPTVKPTELMRYLVRLVTPPGGVVLDPFMGSGSTGKAAVLEGFRFIGIEREAEYLEIARGRIQVPKQTQGTLL
jgi:DNA modification methylase